MLTHKVYLVYATWEDMVFLKIGKKLNIGYEKRQVKDSVEQLICYGNISIKKY